MVCDHPPHSLTLNSLRSLSVNGLSLRERHLNGRTSPLLCLRCCNCFNGCDKIFVVNGAENAEKFLKNNLTEKGTSDGRKN